MKKIEFPVMGVKMISIDKVVSNEYNPNKVATMEMKLLEHSILEDGVTQPIVTYYDNEKDQYVIIDGFHRYSVLKRLGCNEVPIVSIEKDIKNRMASTIRHNRARGKHQVDLQADLVISLLKLGWKDIDIANHLGMTAEEVLRLKQITGIAKIFAHEQYSKSWGDNKNEL